MKIVIRHRNVEVSDALRAHVERRLGLALGRFGDIVHRVIVRFSDAGEHIHCQIDVGLRPRTFQVENTGADLFAAVDNAADQASRSLDRALERERDRESDD